jgi:hypothetical protein
LLGEGRQSSCALNVVKLATDIQRLKRIGMRLTVEAVLDARPPGS